MANGDAAAAAGMDTVPGTADLRDGYDEINKTRDYLADHQTSGTHPASAINSGVLSIDRIPDVPAAKIDGVLDSANIPNLPGSKITSGPVTVEISTWSGGRFGGAWDNNIVTTRRAVWMESNGQLGHTASSRRYKKNVRPIELDLDALLEVPVVTFEYRKTAGGTDSGLIAEDLAEVAGAAFLIDFNTDGSVEGIHYDRLSAALLAIVQRQQIQIDALAAEIATIKEGSEDA